MIQHFPSLGSAKIFLEKYRFLLNRGFLSFYDTIRISNV